MILIAAVVLIAAIALIMAPNYGAPAPFALIGWIALIVGIILLVVALLDADHHRVHISLVLLR